MGLSAKEVDQNDHLNLASFKTKKGELQDTPDVYALERVEHKALWCLWFAKDKVGIEYLSAAEISTILADIFEVSAEESAIRMALTRAREKVHTRTLRQTKRFSIMQAGRDSLDAATVNRAFVVDPAQQHTSIRKIAELLGQFTGNAKICDPYLDPRTLQVLEMIPDSCTIQFLSTPPKQNANALLRQYNAYKNEHGNLEIRTILPGQLHDRYAIVGPNMWLIGHSLNRIGTKQTFIVKLDGDIKQQTEQNFDAAWQTAQILK